MVEAVAGVISIVTVDIVDSIVIIIVEVTNVFVCVRIVEVELTATVVMILSTVKEFVVVSVDEPVAEVISFVTVNRVDSIDRIFDEVKDVFVVVTIVGLV